MTLTYKDLITSVNLLSGWLRHSGIKPGDRVGVCLERSLDSIVALVSVFASGGCYLPLDPDEPEERLKLICKDSLLKGIVVHDKTEKFIQNLVCNNPVIINLDNMKNSMESHPEPLPLSLDDPAYVIYTSGSTGVPKGVVVSHRSLAVHCQAIRDYYQLIEQDKILQFAAFNVDASLEQILPGLTCGAALVVRGKEIWTAQEFGQIIRNLAVSVIDVPPSYLEELLSYWLDSQEYFPLGSLRLCICGGEALLPKTAKQWLNSSLKSVRLINAYGPTEATITSTVFDITENGSSFDLSCNVPVGRPLPHASVYILDENGNPLPEGIAGELYIGGYGVALGYLDQPKLTQSRFVSDSFNRYPWIKNPRLYRTGDRARYIPGSNGIIEFLGRLDQQVKIRGFRIEPGGSRDLPSCV